MSTSRMQRVLTINAGSSSVKFAVFDVPAKAQLFKSEIERVETVDEAVRRIPALLQAQGVAPPDAVGHRVAHGGEGFSDACAIDAKVVAAIEACVPLAPMHKKRR